MLLVEWPKKISKEILIEITDLQNAIEKKQFEGVIETYPSYQILAVAFDPEITSFELLCKELDGLISEKTNTKRFKWTIPVCYHEEHGLDLNTFSKATGLSIEEIISFHSNQVYTVHFIGFLPGFMYLGGLNEKLHLPRKSSPTRSIPKGSVAIGGSQTGIYPTASPGGWNVIGNSPVSFFDPRTNPPCFAKPGDELVFQPISLNTYRLIELEISTGTYSLKNEKING